MLNPKPFKMKNSKYMFLIILTLVLSLTGCGNKKFFRSDSDADGIADKHDECPIKKGLPEYQGCPDTDRDGIPDIDDPCPQDADPYGCADADRDNVPDSQDACPETPGPLYNNGCPIPETAGPESLMEMPVFQLPAPTPSDAETLSRLYFEKAESFEDIRTAISNALQENGYYREGYFWVKGVQISDFGYKNAENSEFTIHLTLEEDEAKH